MNKQDVFNTVVTHLRQQGRKALKHGVGCCYRIEESGVTLKCAVGCLIPESLYFPGLEGLDASHRRVQFVLREEFGPLDPDDIRFLDSLQRVHDNSAFSSWESNFVRIATQFSLTVPKVI